MIEKSTKFGYKHSYMLLMSAIIAIGCFLVIYGWYPLDVTNDTWLIRGYDFTDIIPHYAGWCQFRISSWKFPLGLADTMAIREGTFITYTDSIPYLALFFKLLNPILPETFQYFGWFTLVCFILQAIAAGLLLERKTKNYVLIAIGELFFLTNPVLIERTFKHTALGAQWLILFSLYFYLEYRNKEKESKLPWQMVLFTTLTVGIHPYFLPMVMIFVLLIVIEAVMKRHKWWKTVGFTVLSVLCPILVGYSIGAIGNGVENIRSGYGYFSMNLNSLFNPQSSGEFQWSYILPVRGQILGNYDGFNYLGMGVLLLIPITVLVVIFRTVMEKEFRKQWLGFMKKNALFIVCLLFLTCFAITNTITWDDQVLATFPLPEKLLELCNIFRASGRMFYPVYYTIILAELYCIITIPKKWMSYVILTVVLFVQLFDMRAVFVDKHVEMREKYYDEGTLLQDEVLNAIEGKEIVVIMENADPDFKKVVAAWAGKKGMATAYSVANSGTYMDSLVFSMQCEQNITMGIVDDKILYVTQNAELAGWLDMLYEELGLERHIRGNSYFYY